MRISLTVCPVMAVAALAAGAPRALYAQAMKEGSGAAFPAAGDESEAPEAPEGDAPAVPAPEPATAPVESVADDVQYALNAFVYGSYDEVIGRLRPALLGPRQPNLEPAVLISGLSVLGVSAYFRGDMQLADEAFLALLKREPQYALDPLLYPAAVIARFEEVKRAHAEVLQPAPQGGAPVFIEARVTERSSLGYALPFGVGFLMNGEASIGVGYLVAQTLLGGASVSLYLANESARRADGYFDDPDTAGCATDGADVDWGRIFVVLAGNVIHGLMTQAGTARVEYRALPGPPEGFGPSSSAPGLSFSWSLELP